MGLVLKYVQDLTSKNQGYRYRRRVPDKLQAEIGKTELIASLGKTYENAVAKYPAVHQGFEKLLKAAELKLRAKPAILQHTTDRERFFALVEELKIQYGIDDPLAPYTPSVHYEVVDRDIALESILDSQKVDPDTGDIIFRNPDDQTKALILGGQAKPPAPTLEDAIKLYIAEKISGNDFEYRKKLLRVERIARTVKAALGTMPRLDNFKREEAKKVRDQFLKGGLAPSSVKREISALSGIISHYIREKQFDLKNPFSKLPMPKDERSDLDKHLPFPDNILDQIRNKITSSSNFELQLIWHILEWTGCRIAEVSGLSVEDVDAESDLPHLKIRPNTVRRLKNKSSIREVPLVGKALEAARKALAQTAKNGALFPSYYNDHGPTNVSAALRKMIRSVTKDNRYVLHSLRHGMQDKLIEAEVPKVDRNAILGHLNPGTGETVYGGRLTRLKVLTRHMHRILERSNSAIEAHRESSNP